MRKPLAIVQARMGSTRLPGKMLLPLAGKPLWWHAWAAAHNAFGERNVVVAIPEGDTIERALQNNHLAMSCAQYDAKVFRWDGPEDDVLGRFYHCAHRYRWHPNSVIVRVTPDDPRKSPDMLKHVAAGERLPVELGGEAFLLWQLNNAEVITGQDDTDREHITKALFPTDPPPPPPGIWTVDTQEDYEAMKKVMEG